jgi:glutamate/tyrosine decarboxylase-like PLP-dependent enzyme
MEYGVPWRRELDELIPLILEEARNYLAKVDTMAVRHPGTHQAAKSIPAQFPENGIGAHRALRQLIEATHRSAIATSGPRCFHFVIGGGTPAALAADWLASLYDQIAYAWVSSPLAVQLEVISLRWLATLFGIPEKWCSVMTTGATMSNFVGLAAGRQWVGEQYDVDVAEKGLAGMAAIPVFTSGHIHASTVKTLAMLGIGRSNVRILTRDATGAIDLDKMESALKQLTGRPAILVGTAGEPNAGAFDPISKMADLAQQYNCWLHVDGAFGLFARIGRDTGHLVNGIERAHSITVDGHKWLNVPYDCGFAFVERKDLLVKAFRYTAEYLPAVDDPEPVMGTIGPESSRRARSFAVWSTLKAYGLNGYRQLINHHIGLARYLKAKVDDEEHLERLADVVLNIVCFRYNPGGMTEKELNELNRRLGEAIIEDGRVYVGSTTYAGKVALRPAISNWRTEKPDIDLLVAVVLELGKGPG